MSEPIDPSLVERFWEEGYAVVPGLWGAEEIRSLREGVESLLARDPSAFRPLPSGPLALRTDLLAQPALRGALLDPRVVSVARALLGGAPAYFGDSTLQIGEGERGWHRDNRIPDRWDGRGEDWEGRYPLVRFGVYLQDHADHSGGLSVRVGSHTWGERNRVAPPSGTGVLGRVGRRWHSWRSSHDGRARNVGTHLGDLAVWTLRTAHSGNSVRCRLFPDRKVPPALEGALPRWMAVPAAERRMALFFTLALEGPHLDRYLRYLGTRDYARDARRTSHHGAEALELCRARGVVYVGVESLAQV